MKNDRTAKFEKFGKELEVEFNSPPAGQQVEPDAPTGEQKQKSTKTNLIKNKNTKEQLASTGQPELNPPFGEKDGFERMSVTLPPEIRQRLLDESNNRKKMRSPDWSISVIVREALAAYFNIKG